ncbi:hypothetical protein A2U01_0092090, partial [Trifolium medium]|nr:hypothetical protein [Trifolium medium]
VVDEVRSVGEETVIPSQVGVAGVTQPALVSDYPAKSVDRVSGLGVSPLESGVQGSLSICSPADGFGGIE